MSYLLRRATVADAEAILAIYSHYIEKTIITFELETPSLADFTTRIQAIMMKYPFIVAEKDGVIKGYAYANTFKERLAYRWSLESTVYLHHAETGMGLGKLLYAELLSQLKAINIYNVLGVISLPNEASVALHEKLGFEKVGIMPKIGFKFDQWWDVGFWQLSWEKPLPPAEVKKA